MFSWMESDHQRIYIHIFLYHSNISIESIQVHHEAKNRRISEYDDGLEKKNHFLLLQNFLSRQKSN